MFVIKKRGKVDPFPAVNDSLERLFASLFGKRLLYGAGANAAGANVDGAHFTVGELVANTLQIWIETTLGLDIRVAHQMADLSLFPAHFTLLSHDALRVSMPILGLNFTQLLVHTGRPKDIYGCGEKGKQKINCLHIFPAKGKPIGKKSQGTAEGFLG